MTRHKRNIYGRIFALIFLGVFLLNFASSTLFIHTHVIRGVPMSHSHFHRDMRGGQEEPMHSHTSEEIALILHLCTFDISVVGDTEVDFSPLAAPHLKPYTYYRFPHTYATVVCGGWRAPPYMI